MLLNYGEMPEGFDSSKFSGLTLVPADNNSNSNTAILNDIVNGEVQRQVPVDLNNESVEEIMADLYPTTKIDMSQLPLTEDGELDTDELPDLPEDYQDKLFLVDENLMDSLEENLDDHPYVEQEDDDDYFYDEDDCLERQKREAEAEERAFENFERFCNRMCDLED